MEINGVPLHPLVVHAAVVFTPLAALAGVASVVPAWRERLRWPLVVLAVVSLVSVWVAYYSGGTLRTDNFASATGPFLQKLDDHETWAQRLRIGATVFSLLALASAWLSSRNAPVRSDSVRTAVTVLAAVAAVVTLFLVVATGDAGAQATWNPAG